jgi:hypothetical protein
LLLRLSPWEFSGSEPALIGSEPIPQPHADSAYAFDSANAGGKFWTEQAGISSLVCHTPDRDQAEVDRCWSEAPLFQVDSISKKQPCG